ncbi:NAD-dependent epimerase/dehydratase family protein [Kitasatospora sp. RB6PN24]|uniref:NAD-dependent epimerase/dehydratase family protein n=1 Tax=Kitasatospora humi TaxID=2893891 RepID=UPI001E5CDB9E|nr:NAD-dependent epimerase/dehydratase family protein [Kitasatospora humi]MCC9307917.1 NAD-dependent epimerase/dehydratase family protein [Kitasatospora humi]
MRLLMLGGSGFVGRAVVDDALARGWRVTMLHRGTNRPPTGATVLRGDRTAPDGLAALGDGEWDVVVDTWSAAPSVVRDSARLLADRAGRYVYVSSASVYADPIDHAAAEDGALEPGSPDDGDVAYPYAKRGGELAATGAFGADRSLLLRAGLILGPGEDIGRLTWWLGRIARGGPVLAPGPRELTLQYIDARDLASWALDAAADGLSGPYNTVSRPGHTTMGELLDACVAATGSDAELRWTAPERILAAGIEPWSQLPIWTPPGELHDFLNSLETAKAHRAGLRCRPVVETVADTWTWLRGLGGVAPQRPDRPVLGISPQAEAAALAED